MLKTGIKTIQLEDFEEVKSEVEQLNWFTNEFRVQCPTARIDALDTLGHPMKMWEWARALHLIKEMFPVEESFLTEVLSIGAAYCPLEPALCYLGYKVTEAEPELSCGNERAKVNAWLDRFNKNRIRWIQSGFGTLHERCKATTGNGQYDVVMSISTIEHVTLDLEVLAWKEMADLTRPGGLIIVTMDCMTESKKGYMFDDVRWTNYDMKIVKQKVDELKSYGFKPMGNEDYAFYGNHVNDYSFSFIAMEKTQ